jgi:hypothetical protein
VLIVTLAIRSDGAVGGERQQDKTQQTVHDVVHGISFGAGHLRPEKRVKVLCQGRGTSLAA